MKSSLGYSVLICAIAVFGLSVGEDAGSGRGDARMRREYTRHLPRSYSAMGSGEQWVPGGRYRREPLLNVLTKLPLVGPLLKGLQLGNQPQGGSRGLPGMDDLTKALPIGNQGTGTLGADDSDAPDVSRRRRQPFVTRPHVRQSVPGFRYEHQRF